MPGMFYVIGQMVLSNLVQKVGVCRSCVSHGISWFHCVGSMSGSARLLI